jgi:hypothetical protein
MTLKSFSPNYTATILRQFHDNAPQFIQVTFDAPSGKVGQLCRRLDRSLWSSVTNGDTRVDVGWKATRIHPDAYSRAALWMDIEYVIGLDLYNIRVVWWDGCENHAGTYAEGVGPLSTCLIQGLIDEACNSAGLKRTER